MYYITLDVGGTEVKSTLLDSSGRPCLPEVLHTPAHSDADRETILDGFTQLIEHLAAQIPTGEYAAGIGLAFPGDFDYPRGICLIHDVQKYESLYGVDMRAALTARLAVGPQAAKFPGVPYLLFGNDVFTFGRGEAASPEAKGKARVMCLCIGTGLGSAFLQNGEIITEGIGVPPGGYLYGLPWGGKTMDDCFSRRGIQAVAQQYCGKPLDGLQLFQAASAGDKNALAAWQAFGTDFANAMASWVQDFAPQVLVLGGQVSASADLFAAPLQALCLQHQCQLVFRPKTSLSTFHGLWRMMAGM